jgi:hypothetical protein
VKECRVSFGDRTAIQEWQRPYARRVGEGEAATPPRPTIKGGAPVETLEQWRRRAAWAIHGRPAP